MSFGKDAIEIDEDSKSHQKRSVPQECEPGTTFKRDCNTCTCSDAGEAACTKKRCLNNEQTETIIIKRSAKNE